MQKSKVSWSSLVKVCFVVGVSLGLAACGADDEDDIEIAGDWGDNYDTSHVVTNTTWSMGQSVLTIATFDNSTNTAVAQSPEDDQYSPNLFSKIVWTEIDNGVFYFCTVAFKKDTQEEAEAAEDTSDSSDPDNGGCGGGYAWTKMTRSQT